MLEAGCINVSSNPDKELTKWKGKEFCITLTSNEEEYYYYLQESVEKYEDCPDGYKECGDLDGLQKMCLKESLECPINDIIIDKTSSHDDYQLYLLMLVITFIILIKEKIKV